MSSFSIVMPVRNRVDQVQDSIGSIIRQSHKDWELVIVEDCSDDNKTPQIVDGFAKEDERIKVIHSERWNQRAISRNIGMKAATKDWIIWIDSDDEFLKSYLEVLNSYMNDDFPGYMCYHYGAIVVRMGYQSVRDTANIAEEGDHMAEFPSGLLGTGSFCFNRKVLDEVGYLPETINPFLFADAMKENHPEIVKWYGPIPTNKVGNSKTLGNPWGDDWAMFYKITRKYKSKGLPIAPYVQFVRRQCFSFKKDDQ